MLDQVKIVQKGVPVVVFCQNSPIVLSIGKTFFELYNIIPNKNVQKIQRCSAYYVSWQRMTIRNYAQSSQRCEGLKEKTLFYESYRALTIPTSRKITFLTHLPSHIFCKNIYFTKLNFLKGKDGFED